MLNKIRILLRWATLILAVCLGCLILAFVHAKEPRLVIEIHPEQPAQKIP